MGSFIKWPFHISNIAIVWRASGAIELKVFYEASRSFLQQCYVPVRFVCVFTHAIVSLDITRGRRSIVVARPRTAHPTISVGTIPKSITIYNVHLSIGKPPTLRLFIVVATSALPIRHTVPSSVILNFPSSYKVKHTRKYLVYDNKLNIYKQTSKYFYF